MGKKFKVTATQVIEEEVTVVIDADEWLELYGEEFDPEGGVNSAESLHEYAESADADVDIIETGGGFDGSTAPRVTVEEVAA